MLRGDDDFTGDLTGSEIDRPIKHHLFHELTHLERKLARSALNYRLHGNCRHVLPP